MSFSPAPPLACPPTPMPENHRTKIEPGNLTQLSPMPQHNASHLTSMSGALEKPTESVCSALEANAEMGVRPGSGVKAKCISQVCSWESEGIQWRVSGLLAFSSWLVLGIAGYFRYAPFPAPLPTPYLNFILLWVLHYLLKPFLL